MANLTYLDDAGKRVAYKLSAEREHFAQLMAHGNVTQTEAYCEAYGKQPQTELDWKSCTECASRIANETPVVLRIQELRAPLYRKLKRKHEYSLQRAFEQCEEAYQLAFNQGDAKTLLKAVEMQARLSKLLTETIDVNHRYGLLDDASTEVLLAMRKEFEVRHEKQKKLGVILEGECKTIPPIPIGPVSNG